MITSGDLQAALAEGRKLYLVDVRTMREFKAGHIPGAVAIPLQRLLFCTDLPDDLGEKIVLTCEHGPRAQLAAGILKVRGYSDINLLSGHMHRWRQEGRTIEKEDK